MQFAAIPAGFLSVTENVTGPLKRGGFSATLSETSGVQFCSPAGAAGLIARNADIAIPPIKLGRYRSCIARQFYLTTASASTSPAPCLLADSPRFSAVLSSLALTWAGVKLGYFCSTSAAAPETWGAAMEVPLKVV